MDEEREIAEFIARNPWAWKIWMDGYEAGLVHGHHDERATTDQLVELTARRIITLQNCEELSRKATKNTLDMHLVLKAREQTTVGTYQGGPIPWD